VTGITNFGAFVDIGGGKTGMVHISEVASSYVKEISEHLTVGQVVKVKILNVGADGKISLSIKKVAASEPQRPSAPQSEQDSGTNNARHSSGRRPPHKPDGRNFSNGKPRQNAGASPTSFEDMMARFKQSSEDKISDLKRSDVRRMPRTNPKKGD
jgi:S1 RNA binding domain protein